jgi:uncharacterized protein YebE (UPF0316 family)
MFTENIIISSLLIFVCQVVYIYFRTINVIYTSDKNLWGSIITGNAIGIVWLIVISIGVNSVLQGQIIPIVFYLIGGTIGNYIGIKQNKYKIKKKCKKKKKKKKKN